jgi:hypothetical protein
LTPKEKRTIFDEQKRANICTLSMAQMQINNGYIFLPVYFADTKEADGISSTEQSHFDVAKFVNLYFCSNPQGDADKTTVRFDNGDQMTGHCTLRTLVIN